jgi:WD40 repeat protein
VSKVIAVQRSELGLSGDGIVVFSGSGDGTVRVWDGETGICLATTHFPSSNRVVVISSMVWLSSQKIIAASAADEWKVAFWNVQKNEENKIILTLLHVLSTLSQPCSLFPHTDGSLWKLGPPPLVEVFFPTASHSKQDSEQQLVSFINSFGSFSGSFSSDNLSCRFSVFLFQILILIFLQRTEHSVDNSTFNSTLESLNVLHYKKGLFNKSQNQKKQRVDS